MNLLDGIKILDFTRLLPGPLATHILAQMGAEVIKIEHPKRLDYTRFTGPQADGSSTFFQSLNHNKKQLIIDYNSPKGKKEFFELVKESDILVEQFRPGVMKNWGFDYENIKSINPGIVYVSLTGYGHESFFRDVAGHDINYLAQSGLLSLIKDDEGKPIVPGFQIADISGGSYMAAMSCTSGLIKKMKTGKGCFIDVSMTKAVLPLLTFPINLEWNGLSHEDFNILNGKTLVNYAIYECADHKWLALGALELKFWNNLCDVVNKPSWRRENEKELNVNVFPKEEIEDLFKSKTRSEWLKIFEGKEVCISPVLELSEIENSDLFKNSNVFEKFKTESGKLLKTIGLPFSGKE